MPREKTIEKLLDQATDHYFHISEIHKSLLKYGYGKPFCVFIEEIKARVVYRALDK